MSKFEFKNSTEFYENKKYISYQLNKAKPEFVKEYRDYVFNHPKLGEEQKEQIWNVIFKGEVERKSKKVINKYDLEGNLLATYQGITDTLRNENVAKGSLYKALTGKMQTYKGYKWAYGN